MAKVLIVDDEPNIREVVGLYLRRDGHDVVSATDGEEALEVFRETEPDLVVLDLMLPRIGGPEVCRRMRTKRRVDVNQQMRQAAAAFRRQTDWYHKAHPSLADAPALVRKELWAQEETFSSRLGKLTR